MTQTTIGTDFNPSLDIESNIAAKIAFHAAVVVDILSELRCIVLREIPHADVGIYAGSCADVGGSLAADAKNIGKSLNPGAAYASDSRRLP